MVEKKYSRKILLHQPRTICTDKSCLDVWKCRDGEILKVWMNPCHRPCYMSDIKVDQVRTSDVRDCLAFDCGNSDTCSECHHSWLTHIHVVPDVEEHTELVPNPAIQKQLDSNATEINLRQTGITQLTETIKKYEEERSIIRHAMAQFVVFLQRSALLVQNDATLDYLEMLIRNLQGEVDVLRSLQSDESPEMTAKKERLDGLKEDREQLRETFSPTPAPRFEPARPAGKYDGYSPRARRWGDRLCKALVWLLSISLCMAELEGYVHDIATLVTKSSDRVVRDTSL